MAKARRAATSQLIAAARPAAGAAGVHSAMLKVVQRSQEEEVKKKWEERPQETGKRPVGAAEYDVKDATAKGALAELASTNCVEAEKASQQLALRGEAVRVAVGAEGGRERAEALLEEMKQLEAERVVHAKRAQAYLAKNSSALFCLRRTLVSAFG